MDSSAISGMSYNKDKQVLTVVFARTGGRYKYLDVPPSVWEAFNSAPSHGTYFNANIRNAYEFESD